MSEFKLHLRGDNAGMVAEKISQIIEETFDRKPTVQRVAQPAANGKRSMDPVALAALVLAIPGAALAAMDVLQRMKKKAQAEKVLEQVKQIMEEYPSVAIHLEAPDGTIIDVRKTSADKLLDAANDNPQKQGDD